MNISKNKIISFASLLILAGIYFINEHIYFNPSTSEQRGYYFVYKPHVFNRADLVLSCIRDVRSISILHKFGLPYMSSGGCALPFLLKKIAAIDGDMVVVGRGGIFINNVLLTNTTVFRKYQNIQLNPLHIGTTYKLGKDEYFLLGNGKNSYDSRYFGVVKNTDLQYRAILFIPHDQPIW
ncbi:MAG: Peptidase [Burkholderiales bacterium]|nr:Peptidase [Burkholderiales bacterium]